MNQDVQPGIMTTMQTVKIVLICMI